MWENIGIAIFASCFVGGGAFYIICPYYKRGVAANRITVVVALLAYLSCLAASSLKYFTTPTVTFSFHDLNLFLLEGVLIGAITMGIIYGIAQVIHWAIKGEFM